ncbi:hypothetical protein O6H91_04G110700 [Diphasiastrum complanatum]|uniref:Uncharacterized protein n=1 Tax=Diphasiastrum complanatum TaxID=34168 RepID=A0ACC2E090_DIPCM|nr:hypothetical protein O6H91_Y048700 [Diphasiastrum complanatum]KAJ7560009.1 hypothetical protein O6H91_04G110700 [Diphasiastrum complanatum]
MGCANTKIDNEENVARCRNRKRFMKQAVASRHALAAAHIAYIYSLKNIGAAFRQFADSDVKGCRSPIPSLLKTSSEPLPPPTPLFLRYPSPPATPIHRSVSLPALRLQNGAPSPDKSKLLSPPASLPEEDDDEEHKDYLYGDAQPPPPPTLAAAAAPPPPPAPRSFTWDFTDFFRPAEPSLHLQEMRKSKQMQEAMEEQNGTADYSPAPYPEHGEHNDIYGDDQTENDRYMHSENDRYIQTENDKYMMSEGSSPDNVIVKSEVVNELVCLDRREMALVPSLRTGTELVDVLKVVDDWFLKAHESGKDVGRLLEALRIQYHSNFIKPKGFPDRTSSKIVRTMSLNRWSSHSQRMTLPIKGMVEDSGGMAGSHASTLDRLFAWEKRLYEEVKGAETIRTEYEKQCALLRRKNTRGAGNESIDKTRAAINSLRTRIVIALQAVDTVTTAVHKLRDEELYPQLLEILQGLTFMWNEMYDCHQRQREIVKDMKALEVLESADATSNLRRQATSQLELSLTNWYNSLNKVINTQREYLHNVNSWLRLSLQPVETEPRDRLSSPVRNDPPPIYYLCIEWQQALDRLPDKVALEAIKSFSAVVRVMVDLQSDEVRHRKKVEVLSRELHRRVVALQNYERKHADEVPFRYERNELITAIVPYKTPHSAKQAAIDVLKRKLDEENEKVKKAIQASRAMTINSFQTGLPSIFQAVTGFAQVCCQTYQGLYSQINSNQFSRINR